jgi:branched-chain amino acid transport system ATP-binding protein
VNGAATRPCALQLKDLHKRFGATPIIRGVSLDIYQGERHAIIGPNGAGKSTLFNLVSGLLSPTAGSIRLDNEPIEGRSPFEICRRGLARSFQVTNIFPRLSVYENIRCSVLWSLGHRYSFMRDVSKLIEANERTHQVLEQIGMTERRDVRAGVLTYAAGDRDHHRRQRARDSARRTHGGNEPGRSGAGGCVDPLDFGGSDAGHGRT